ncbi:c-type cytochrome biogenesis protein CcsB [Microtetraspora sp. NBRC 13810]|uniref:c-type cytochrome biogenesis protein CcsB n=1 Tax=Microtetraspora sp. NBRC 13810 TaxID=3030990 RepID=UPI0024A2E8C5|nr:c-type cytochrome biogenesis protein CcsB [Microtetraspora sp. NBRC 13810]GLW11587.1 c-type cytochrome biogenesis protein CcsB [Microtetraspora sp. NBRC 13810]
MPYLNTGLATLSDQLVLACILLYVLAMIGYALQLGFGHLSTARPVGALLANSSAPAGGSGADDHANVSHPRWAAVAGTAAMLLCWLGWTANLGAVLARGIAVARWPWGNMYEFIVAMSFGAVTAFLFMQLRHPMRFLGPFVCVAATLGLGFAVRYLHVQAGPVMPALNTYWIAIHVSAAVVASGLFIVAGVTGILYLVRKSSSVRLPSRSELELVAHRAIVIAFPIWTFAVIAGALWADKAWGRYWGWDPKEIWAFITWITYAAYLHARVTAGWRGTSATIVQLVGLATLLFNLIGVNMFIAGLHSYAGLPG